MSRQNFSAPPGRGKHRERGEMRSDRIGMPVGQAQYLAGLLVENEKAQKQKGNTGGSQTAEAIQRTRARVTLRYFNFERACGVRHTYRDSGR